MGEIVGAGIMSHVPTMVLPEAIRHQLNEGREISLVPGAHRLKAEVLDQLEADTYIVFDTHWFTTVEFVVASHARRAGLYTSEELPRGMSQVPYDMPGDTHLAELIETTSRTSGVPMTAIDDPYLPINYATINMLGFLQGAERWISVSIPQTAETDDFLRAGTAIGEAITKSDRRVVLLASGGMSHRFWPLSQLGDHESSDPSHIRSPEARAADEQRLEWFREGNHAEVIDTMDDYARFAPEGRFGHYLQMVGAIGGRGCLARGRQFSDYENAVGTGQVHVWFDRPAEGWT